MLGDQNQMSLTRNPGPKCEVPGVSAHHFNHLDPAVGPGGRARALDYLSYIAQRSIETERVISAGEILIDRLRNPDDAHAFLRQLFCDAKCIFSSANHYCIQVQFSDVLNYLIRSIN